MSSRQIARAVQLYQAGELAQAEALCLQVVRNSPRQAEAWNLLGVIAFQSGKLEAALQHFEKAAAAAPGTSSHRGNRAAILVSLGRHAEAEAEFRAVLRVSPSHAESHYNFGNLLHDLNRLAEAEACYRQAIKYKSNYPEAHTNLGNLLRKLERASEAEACYRQALKLKPANLEALNNLGSLLTKQEKYEEALPLLRQALTLAPNSPEANCNLGNVVRKLKRLDEAAACYRRAAEIQPALADAHTNLGNVLREQDRPEEAEKCYRRVVELTPADAEAYINLGTALEDQHRYEEAETCCRRALELRPDFPVGLNNLGNVLQRMGRLTDAEIHYRRALELQPNFPEAATNLGVSLMDMGRLDDAVTSLRRALEQSPTHCDAHFCLSQVMLLTGDYEHGWSEYEWRWRLKSFRLPSFPQPLWDGSPLIGRTILLQSEQGFGDTIQFIRYAALAKERGGTVVYQCPKRLIDVLRTCAGVDRIVPADAAPPPFDTYASLLTLPRILGTTLATIPARVPYVQADPVLVERWREQMVEPGFKIGIVWQGSPSFSRDRQRSVPLTCFESLSSMPGVRLFSLQVGAGTEQLASQPFPVVDLGSHFDAASFSDAAAVMQNLDLIVTVDSSPAHLAGALGRPVWVALPFTPDWRWLLDREDTPWYPTMRLFRQKKPGEWDDVFEQLTEAVKDLMYSSRSA